MTWFTVFYSRLPNARFCTLTPVCNGVMNQFENADSSRRGSGNKPDAQGTLEKRIKIRCSEVDVVASRICWCGFDRAMRLSCRSKLRPPPVGAAPGETSIGISLRTVVLVTVLRRAACQELHRFMERGHREVVTRRFACNKTAIVESLRRYGNLLTGESRDLASPAL